MNEILKRYDTLCFVLGRSLLGFYFLVPGVMKIMQYNATTELMVTKGVPMTSLLLPLTIVLQIGLGALLIVGKQLRLSALLLCGLTLLINLFIHNFWDLQSEPNFGRELQNFIKNLGIAAGLLLLASNNQDQHSDRN